MSGSGITLNIAQDAPATYSAHAILSGTKVDKNETILIGEIDQKFGALLPNFYDDQFIQVNEVFQGTRFIDALGIGSPVSAGNSDAREFVVGSTSTATTGVTILTQSTSAGKIAFGDGDDTDAAFVAYNHNIDTLVIAVGGSNEILVDNTNMRPAADGGLGLGSNTVRWATTYTDDLVVTDTATVGSGSSNVVVSLDKGASSTATLLFEAAGTTYWGWELTAGENYRLGRYSGGVVQDHPLDLRSSEVRLGVDGGIPVRLPSFTNANRPAAGNAGHVIFNTDDGQLNIDDGTNWTLPDGTTT